ncbi:MAG: hypothetical protein HN833_01480 [Elusimicrobiaceae bacterium]|nr:hypothetical protein [Elusimicrobiaceae bacterium]MBT3954956.1 hypothetical protein [Elusimicrobiaceae bacterium]MBT4008606.1 hypothetical protein [Elusimicrobiaceae bacterium]MBT4402956.1 hypothetical protein [Elusimicrobiaceae bacterium]MBT4439772.1 hypothetical protein [Elusimicrobiaceae bacterium]
MIKFFKKTIRPFVPEKVVVFFRSIFPGKNYTQMGNGDILVLSGLFNNIKLNCSSRKIILTHPWEIPYKKSKNSKFFECFKNDPNIDLIINKQEWENKKNNFVDKDEIFFIFPLDYESFIASNKWYTKPLYENNVVVGYDFFKNKKSLMENFLTQNKVPLKNLYPKIYFSNNEVLTAEKIIKKHNLVNFLCVYPFPNKKNITKNWGKENWQKIIDKTNQYIKEKNLNIKIVYFGTKDQEKLNNVVDLRGKTSFRESVALVNKSIGVISYNGAGVHVARAVKKPCICICSGVEIKEHIAYPNDTIVINHKTKCCGCGLYAKCDNGLKCLTKISPENVFEEVKNHLLNI